MSLEEYRNSAMNNRAHIVLLENNVLDLKEWEVFHPGGKLALQKNRGRDVTKFFYGGYQLV